MTVTKGNGPDATNDRPAKIQTNNATDFIAAYARAASVRALFHAKPYAGIGGQKYRAVGAVIEFRPVLENTKEYAGNLPDSEVFSRSESFGFGRDGLVREAGRMAYSMFSTSRPPVALEKAASGFQSQYGAKTMTTVNTTITPKMGILGNTPATSPAALVRRLAIEAALSAALHLVRTSDTPHSIQAATGRACRAASMLKQACAESKTTGSAA